jgi:hypothetical protein
VSVTAVTVTNSTNGGGLIGMLINASVSQMNHSFDAQLRGCGHEEFPFAIRSPARRNSVWTALAQV